MTRAELRNVVKAVLQVTNTTVDLERGKMVRVPTIRVATAIANVTNQEALCLVHEVEEELGWRERGAVCPACDGRGRGFGPQKHTIQFLGRVTGCVRDPLTEG